MIERDDIMGRTVPLEPGERVVATFAPDRRRFLHDTGMLAVAAAVGVGLVLVLIGNPHVLIGGFGAALAIVVRAAFLASESLAARWTLTPRRLIGPGGRVVPLAEIAAVRRLLGDVQIVTRGGDKHLIRHQRDATGAVAALREAAARAGAPV
jgi:hypothetical protein